MEELNDIQNVVVGCIAGCIECLIDHPLITWKNMKQQSLPFSIHPRIVYRGLIADMIGLSALTGIQFVGTGSIKHLMIKYKNYDQSNTQKEFDFTSLTHNELLLSSFIGGMISGIAVSPFDLIMIQQQRYGGSLWNTFHRITNQHGIQIMSRGVISSMFREGIFTMGYLGIQPILEHMHSDRTNKKYHHLYNFGCAMISGLIAMILSHPFDTLKTCMQGDLKQKDFKGLTQTFRFLYGTYGIKRIYAGFNFRFGTVVCSFFVFNRVMEYIAPQLYHQQFINNINEN